MANHTNRTRGAGCGERRNFSYSRPRSVRSVRRTPISERCDICGRLECLCRPRFFAGQLLTEEDLNRLDRYIVKKQQLHNRHLHGWGVVCGLELRCDPCDDLVQVTSGYAVSPCGEDIVVCRDDRVPICELIEECLDRERREQPCEPTRHSRNEDCLEEEQDWLLMIRYEEQPSRGTTALRNATAENRCRRCGGNSIGGCHCAETNSHHHPGCGPDSVKPPPAQCEPTIVCESYRYEVCPLPDDRHGQRDMGLRAEQCLEPFQAIMKRFPDLFIEEPVFPSGHEELYALCCDLKAALIDIFSNRSSLNCTLLDHLHRINCQGQGGLAEQIVQLLRIFYIGFIECSCSVFLPPCQTSHDNRIVLGRITVYKRDCKVVRVCNWISERKLLITIPTLEYWLSPLLDLLPEQYRNPLGALCCGNIIKLEDHFSHGNGIDGVEVPPNTADEHSGRRVEGISGMYEESIVKHLLTKDGFNLADTDGKNIFAKLISHKLGVTSLDDFVGRIVSPPQAPSAEKITEIKTEIEKMNKKMKKQDKQIKELKLRLNNQ